MFCTLFTEDEQRPRGGGSPWTADEVRGAALASSTGSYRPLYLKFQTPPDGATVERGFSVLPSKLAAVSISGGEGGGGRASLNQTWPPPSTAHHSPRVLTPTQHRGRRMLEPLNPGDDAFVRRRSPGVTSGARTKIPPLTSPSRYEDRDVDSGQRAQLHDSTEEIIDLSKYRSRSRSEGVVERSASKHGKRKSRNRAVKVLHDPVRAQSSPSIHVESVSEDCTILQKPMLARQPIRNELSSSIHSEGRQSLSTPPAEPFLPAVDAQVTRSTPPTPVTDSHNELEFKSIDENDDVPQQHSPQPAVEEDPSPIQQMFQTMEAEERAYKYQLLKEQESQTPAPSSSPAVEEKSSTTPEVTTSIVSVPSTPQKLQPPVSIIHLNPDEEDHKDAKRTTTTWKMTPRRHVRRFAKRNYSQILNESAAVVKKPKEEMQQCLTEMQSTEWEVVVQGLHTLMKLCRHHRDTVQHHLHSVMVALGKQVRNLRSQVAREACQACADLFVSQKRAVEPDLDEVAAPLLHRTADTNRFLRADSNAALDIMVENISPSRAVSVIVSKGVSHQNAVVRTCCARLLVKIVKRMGVDKVMTPASDMRDKILLTGANLLTEGSLDTRCLAKELFRLLSEHPSFLRTMNDVIPSQLLRNISKTLKNLK